MNLETFFLFNWPFGLQEIIKSNKVKSKFIDRKSYFDGWDMILPFLNHVLSKIYEYQFNNAVNFHYQVPVKISRLQAHVDANP